MDPEDIVPAPLAARHRQDASDGEFAPMDGIAEPVQEALQEEGIEQLYQHQQEGLDALADGSNVVISTPTASGKSLVYTVPALESALEGGRTLYIAPMRALINDQEATIRRYAKAAGLQAGPVQAYTGALSTQEKRRVRGSEPEILLTTIDMVHYSLLPYATASTWDWLFSSLDLIVIDELHEFRGVFGSHVSLVFRRLQRMLRYHHSDPAMVACSATIGNPTEHARAVTGREEWVSIEDNTAATGATDWTIVDNSDSPHPVSRTIMERLVQRDIQSLAFTSARQTSERYARQLQNRLREDEKAQLAEKITAYHAALNDSERREMEHDIRDGDLLGVWSTTALELGVDIGTLDAVILDGYPGSRMQAQQQAGRAGRGKDESDVFLVPGNDSLDQYIASNTDELFEEPEHAKVNPQNTEILPQHLGQAADERRLTTHDTEHFDAFEEGLKRAKEDGLIEKRGRGWTATDKMDGKPFNLRNIDDRNVELTCNGYHVAELGYSDAIKDVYPDAIYLHNGKQYRVTAFDRDADEVRLERVRKRLDYYTRPMKQKRIEVDQELERKQFRDLEVLFADVTVHGNVTGYYKNNKSSAETIERTEYDQDQKLPFSFRTKAIGFDLQTAPAGTTTLGDGLHAAEHAMIGIMPLHVLCDRNHDLGGLSTELHGYTGDPTIFIHEGHEGGVGLVAEAFDILDTVVEDARKTVATCDCEEGCDACIYSPTCGNANNHLDKDDGTIVLEHLRDRLLGIDS